MRASEKNKANTQVVSHEHSSKQKRASDAQVELTK